MLRVIISPAKKMLAGSDSFAVRNLPALTDRAQLLLEALIPMDAAELQGLWNVGDKLLGPCLDTLEELRRHGIPADEADLADPAFSTRISPAVFAYVGIQYQSMAPQVMDERALTWLQEHLRILSGFYGSLRPFDAVLPYRLEMGAKLAVDSARDLYGFWNDAIATEVCRGAGADGAAIVNLASVEYAKAVLPHLPEDVSVTTCIFGEELRGGKPVQRATASKIARGSMVRWMAEGGIDDPAALTRFDVGYRFEPELSCTQGAQRTLVFMRDDRP